MYLLPIGGAYLILGDAWLATIGLHLVDYKSLQIKFYHQGQFVTLQGDVTLKPVETHLNHLRILHHVDAIAEIFTLQLTNMVEPIVTLFEVPETIALDLALLVQ